ncbi:hypothetical protein MLD52_07305 [Puniceicoccaceae bacterium K14]|nr:hypothetical protein [Puniceicoccaceae bacterium K14]
MKRIITLTLAISISAINALAEESSIRALPSEVAAKVEEIGETYGQELAKSFLSLDEDGDGRISLKTVLGVLMKRGFARPGGQVPDIHEKIGNADRYRRGHADADKRLIKLIKQDQAGMVGIEEIVAALQKGLTERVSKLSPLDMNQDGKLTLSEYAISVPIRKDQAVDQEGYTEQQRKGFSTRDTNEDGYLIGEEWISGYTVILQDWISGVGLTVLVDKLDTDGDSVLSSKELGEALPGVESLPESVALSGARYWLRELPTEQKELLSKVLLPITKHDDTPMHKWSPMVAAWYGEEIVARYRAALFDKTLVVEATYSEGWRSYAMDNLQRAEAVFGPGSMSERPTQITLDENLTPEGEWRQTKPQDMSKPDIEWYTWGFEKKAFFTRQLTELPHQEFQVKINAQICNNNSCSMANDLQLTVSNQPNTQESPVTETVEVLGIRDPQVVKN